MGKKYSTQQVIEIFRMKGYIPLFDVYKDSYDKVTALTKDGYKVYTNLTNLLHRNPDVFSKLNPYILENISKWLKNNKLIYTVVSKEYYGNSKLLVLNCPIHGDFTCTWNNLKNGHGCPKCGGNYKPTFEEAKEKVNTINNNIIILSTKYINKRSHIKCKCKIDGYEWTPTWDDLINSKSGCPECKRLFLSGENNNNYNPLLTDEERAKGRKLLGEGYNVWVKDVYTRDNYTCQICGKSHCRVNAHHLDGYHWCRNRRTDITNGVTLCDECHKEFHSTYGIKNNTENQFKQFKAEKAKNKINKSEDK